MEGRHHPCKTLDCRGEPVEIDNEIVPLVELLWAHGLETSLSCQEDPEAGGRVWVEFWEGSAERFVRLVARGNPDLARTRMLPCEDSYDGGWRYSTLPHRMDDGELESTTSVFFPRSDLSAVVTTLEEVRRIEALDA